MNKDRKFEDFPEIIKDVEINRAHEQFVAMLNSGDLYPHGIKVSEAPIEEIINYEQQLSIVPTNSIDTLQHQLEKLYVRFTAEPDRSENTYNKFLQERGFTGSENLLSEIAHNSTIMYFPVGFDSNGKLCVTKQLYFAEALQYEMLISSEWDLLNEKQRTRLKTSRHTAIGLSVGSWLTQAALLSGITKFDLADPGKIHVDAVGRLNNFGFSMDHLGVNKTAHAMYEIYRIYPYAQINAYFEGITQDNVADVFNKNKAIDVEDGVWFIAEEADVFDAKRLARVGLHQHLSQTDVDAMLVMIADIGNRASVFTETKGSEPFQGMLAAIDPNGDPYGSGLEEKYGPLVPLFATINGVSGVPDPLLSMVERGEIGEGREGTKITRVPQSHSATSLSAAAYANVLRLYADGKEIRPQMLLDIGRTLSASDLVTPNEVDRQEALNKAIFGKESLI